MIIIFTEDNLNKIILMNKINYKTTILITFNNKRKKINIKKLLLILIKILPILKLFKICKKSTIMIIIIKKFLIMNYWKISIIIFWLTKIKIKIYLMLIFYDIIQNKIFFFLDKWRKTRAYKINLSRLLMSKILIINLMTK